MRSLTLSDIAQALAKAGQIDRALQVAEKIANRSLSLKDTALRHIVEALAQRGQIDRAVKLAEKIEALVPRLHAFAAIVAAKREAQKAEKR